MNKLLIFFEIVFGYLSDIHYDVIKQHNNIWFMYRTHKTFGNFPFKGAHIKEVQKRFSVGTVHGYDEENILFTSHSRRKALEQFYLEVL